jgi:hypothetical protein
MPFERVDEGMLAGNVAGLCAMLAPHLEFVGVQEEDSVF